MKVFISYSRHDEGAVRSMVADLQRARVDVWLDEQLGGGDTWWAAILEKIRDCTVFVFALSDMSLNSKPCRAEVDYATSLGLPILPVQIGYLSTYRTDGIFDRQLIDYRAAIMDRRSALVAAMQETATQRKQLPDPLPESPAIPYEYLMRLGSAIRANNDLSFSMQSQMLFELRNSLSEEEDPSVQEDIRALLRALGRRKDVVQAIASEIDTLLHSGPASAMVNLGFADRPASPASSVDSVNTASQGGHILPFGATATAEPLPAAPTTTGSALFRRLTQHAHSVVYALGIITVAVIAVVATVNGHSSTGKHVPSSPSVAASATPTLGTQTTDDLARLLTLVPIDVSCSSPGYSFGGPDGRDGGVDPAGIGFVGQPVSGVRCKSSQFDNIIYALFRDKNALDEAFDQHQPNETLVPCPGPSQSPQEWHHAATPTRTEGRIACLTTVFSGGMEYPSVVWTIDSELLFGSASGPNGGSIDQVYQWWAAHYQ